MAMNGPVSEPPADPAPTTGHPRLTRLWHWANVIILPVMLMSGLTIFNAHPRLYWGHAGNLNDYAWFAVGSSPTQSYVRIGETRIPSTGWIGNWTDDRGRIQTWAFPSWATIPSRYDLAAGRRWHFFFAWLMAGGLAAYMIGSLANGHIRRRLHLSRTEWYPRSIWRDMRDHLSLSMRHRAELQHYNILQKFAYIGVIFLALPVMIATGLAMAPGMDASAPWLVDLFGGRQSARSVHFITAFSLLAFFLIHMAMLLVSRPLARLRTMVRGRPA